MPRLPQPPRRSLTVVAVLSALILAGALTVGLLLPAEGTPAARLGGVGPSIGQRAPDVVATKTLDGAPASLAAYKGRTVVLAFWTTWCPGCRTELPALDQLAALRPELRVVAVESDGSRATVLHSVKELGLSHLTVWRDPAARTLHDRYLTHAVPALFVIGPDGTVANSTLGGAANLDELTTLLFGT